MSKEACLSLVQAGNQTSTRNARIHRFAIIALNVGIAVATTALVLFTLYPKPRTAVVFGVALAIAVGTSGIALAVGLRKATTMAVVLWLGIAVAGSHISLGYRESLWPGFRLDPAAGWQFMPNLRDVAMEAPDGTYRISTDERGWRNTLPYPADDRLPVVLQGDSLAFGFGLDATKTFCAVFTELSSVPCFNFGVVGYDLQHIYFQGQALTRRYRIGARIILVNIGNDFTLSALESPYLLKRPYVYLEGDRLVPVMPPPMPLVLQAYGHHFIRPYAAYNSGLRTVSIGRGWARWAPAWLGNIRLASFAMELTYPRLAKLWYGWFDPTALVAGQQLNPYYPSWQLQAARYWPEPYRSFQRDFAALIGAIGAQAAERAVLVLVPTRAQVISREQADVIDTHIGDRSTVDLDSVNRLITDAARNAGMTTIDLTPIFRADGAPRRLYQADQHLSEAGMRLAVEQALAGLGPFPSGSSVSPPR